MYDGTCHAPESSWKQICDIVSQTQVILQDETPFKGIKYSEILKSVL